MRAKPYFTVSTCLEVSPDIGIGSFRKFPTLRECQLSYWVRPDETDTFLSAPHTHTTSDGSDMFFVVSLHGSSKRFQSSGIFFHLPEPSTSSRMQAQSHNHALYARSPFLKFRNILPGSARSYPSGSLQSFTLSPSRRFA